MTISPVIKKWLVQLLSPSATEFSYSKKVGGLCPNIPCKGLIVFLFFLFGSILNQTCWLEKHIDLSSLVLNYIFHI